MPDMNTGMTCSIDSIGSDDTGRLGERLGANLRGGEVIELISDLGGGKTTFTRGLAKGAGSVDRVASPTFTIFKVYKGDKFEIHHFDFYRLQDAGLMEHELADVLGDPNVVVIVEWGDVARHVLPEERLTVKIKQTGDNSRHFEFSCPIRLKYLTEDLC